MSTCACAALTGASPLTRGKPRCYKIFAGDTGRIPAHAGKTNVYPHDGGSPGAHPRSRGENLTGRQGLGKSWGASPLTRGKPSAAQTDWRKWGRIPAHAGKTSTVSARPSRSGAHPRSRGENLATFGQTLHVSGASPLTRGKPLAYTEADEGRGRIPAHAGKTLPDLRFYRADRSDLGKP